MAKQYQKKRKIKKDYENDEGDIKPAKKKRPKTHKVGNQNGKKVITYINNMTVADISKDVGISNAVIMRKLMSLGVMTTINQALEREVVELLALELGYGIEDEVITDLTRFEEMDFEDKPEDLVYRPPIVTVMGHVDHGKTTLLDTIRQTRVAAGEAGGITQHIGAYQVDVKGQKITFIDTPGHAAFTEMRARGAQVTDITIIVVAADDGVMPQTKEAIDHARSAKVPIIIAINKIDRPQANIEHVKSELSDIGIIPEEWGGDVPFVEISALKEIGIDELLEMVVLVSQMEDLKANPNRDAMGTVVEAKLDKGRGVVATVIIANGTLKVGDNIICGNTYGKIRTMTNVLNKRVKKALPSEPVEITGLMEVPFAGDKFITVKDEREARQVAESRTAKQREGSQKSAKRASLKNLFKKAEAEEKEVNLIIKGDTQGSIEAIKGSLEKINIEGFTVNIVRSGVGAITENDITLAKASDAIVLGFNVRPIAAVRDIARNEGVEIRLYSVIYKLIEEIEAALTGMLSPEYEEVVTGQVVVREIFKISKLGTIAGCYVTDGSIKRNSGVRVLRNGIVVYEGKLASLKRFKDDAREVAQGYECGLSIENYNDLKVDDVIEAFIDKEVERT